ncbi:unnamed protein product, partial [marine sediment metagenome]
ALSDPSWEVVDAAVEALGEVGVRAIGRLQNVLRDPAQSLTVRYQVARAVAGMGHPAITALVAALSEPNPEVRKWSAVALGEIGFPDAAVIEALESLERTSEGDLNWVVQEQLRRLRRITSS